MAVKQTAENGIGKGKAGPGRPRGKSNKTTSTLKEAILAAAEQVGHDGQGKDGLTGYLKKVAETDVKAFSTLLGKVLPLQLAGDGGGPISIVISPEDADL